MRAVSRILTFALIGIGCGTRSEPQTAAAAMQLVCDAHHRSGAENANPAERQQTMSRWLAKEVTNPEIRALVQSLGVLVLAAVRATESKELFSGILLSVGFE